MIKKFLKNKVVKNAGWIIFGKIAQAVIGMLIGLLAARYLGPSNYGLINYAVAYLSFFNSICTLGTTSLLVKEFVDHPENEGQIIGTTLTMRILSSTLSALVITLISFVVDRNEPVTIAVVALSSIGVIFHVFETFVYWFQYKLASKVTSIISVVAYVIVALYRVVLLVMQKNVMFFAFATTLDYICVAILLVIAYRKYKGRRLSFSWTYGKSLLSKSYHFILSGLMVAVYAQTDKIMLKHMVGSVATGYYATAVYISNLWCFILSAIITSMYPVIMQANQVSESEFKKKNKMLYAIVFYLSVIVSVFFTVFAPLIIDIMYGNAYSSAVGPLRIVTWYTAFSYLGVARDAWVVCKNKQKYLKDFI